VKARAAVCFNFERTAFFFPSHLPKARKRGRTRFSSQEEAAARGGIPTLQLIILDDAVLSNDLHDLMLVLALQVNRLDNVAGVILEVYLWFPTLDGADLAKAIRISVTALEALQSRVVARSSSTDDVNIGRSDAGRCLGQRLLESLYILLVLIREHVRDKIFIILVVHRVRIAIA